MITMEEAIKIAKEKRDDLDLMVEYETGYVFSSKSDEGYEGGMEHSPIVVLKKNGRIADMSSFMFSGPGKEIKRVKI